MSAHASAKIPATTQTRRYSPTSNGAGMKKPLYHLAAILCLLTIFVSSLSCIHLAMAAHQQAEHQQAASNQCPMHAPQNQNVPSCCKATHQTPAAITTAALQQPVFLVTTLTPLPPDQIAPRLSPLPTQFAEPPLLPPRIALRI